MSEQALLPTRPIKTEEVALLTGFAIQTIYHLAKNGDLPCIKKGKTYIFYRAEILSWLEKGRVRK